MIPGKLFNLLQYKKTNKKGLEANLTKQAYDLDPENYKSLLKVLIT